MIFDATGERKGRILVAYDIIPKDSASKFPKDKINIRPKCKPGVLSMGVIGMRDVIGSLDMLPVKKLFFKFDISGDTKEPIITNNHPVIGGAANFLEVLAIPFDVPLEIEYSPVLTVYCYDTLLGAFGKRLVGICNIPLEKFCAKILAKLEAKKELGMIEEVAADDIEVKMKQNINNTI